jgi:hypothetical protein
MEKQTPEDLALKRSLRRFFIAWYTMKSVDKAVWEVSNCEEIRSGSIPDFLRRVAWVGLNSVFYKEGIRDEF